MAQQEVDRSGRFAEAITPPSSPPERHTSPMSEMIDNTPPIAMEHHEGFQQSETEKKWQAAQAANQAAFNQQHYYSAPEVVDPNPPQYGEHSSGAIVPDHAAKKDNEYRPTPIDDEHAAPVETKEPKLLGMRRRIAFIVLGAIALIVLAVALGAGLGIGLKKKNKGSSIVQDPFCGEHPELCIGGSLNAEYYSSKGAFNGSGIALSGGLWLNDQERLFTLYFQHHSGDIRYMTYDTNQNWAGGNSSTVIATDAKNATGISAVQFMDKKNATVIHIFYISKDDLMKQKSWTNETNKWEDGLVNSLNLKVYDAPHVGMQACWKGNFYTDSDTNSFSNEVDTSLGINLWFPSDDSTFEQYAWYTGADKWERLDPWQGKNVYAGVGCYSWEQYSTTSYTMMSNKQNVTEIWWKDTNTNQTSSASHPVNSWKNSTSGAIGGTYPTTPMGYTNNLYLQMADKSIMGYNLNYTAETTSTINKFTITDPAGPAKGLGGTKMTCTSYAKPDPKNATLPALWNSLYVFYQTKGDDITAFTRPFDGGQWTGAPLIIPDN